MADKVFKVLFVCRQNAACSQMAEALLGALGKRRFIAFSAGTEPAETIDTLTLETIHKSGQSIAGLTVKGLNAFTAADAPHMDFVFIVCEDLAELPLDLPGHPMLAHWPIPDPLTVKGSHAERAAAFAETFKMIRRRVELFVELPMAGLDHLALQRSVNEIGASR